jgi:alpha-L-rhamnosidase
VPSTGWGYNWGNGPDWSSALTLIPWYIYLYTGSIDAIEENYEAIKRHFGFMESMTEDGIVNYGIGDWCPPFEGKAVMATMSSFKCPVEVTDTAYYFNAANTIAMMAAVIGKEKERKIFSDKALGIKENFRKKFFDEAKSLVKGDCQTALSCMVYQELCKESEIPALLKNLITMITDNNFHQDTGILGNKYLHNILGENGLMDISLKMILNETYPSFRNWIERGATTLWECWNGEGSRNHHMFSDFIAVLFKYLGGIKPDESEPGFRKIIMKPQVNCGLKWVKAEHLSSHGKIRLRWEIKNSEVLFDILIPDGCKAIFEVPGIENSHRIINAGSHVFSVKF